MKNTSQISWQIREPIVPPDNDKSYFLRLHVVTFLAILPVLAYCLIFVGASIYYLYSAIAYFPGLFAPSSVVASGAYTALMFVALIFLVLLSRPFFALKGAPNECELDAESEQTIYALTQEISQSLGINLKFKISVNMDVAVDAKFLAVRDYRESELSMAIGLPLLQTLDNEHLTSLVARELSRFSSPTVSRPYSLLRATMSWLFRVTNNSDGWETRISLLGEKNRLRWLKPLVTPLIVGINVINLVFRAFLTFAETVAKSAIREMEFRADYVQAQLLGSDGFTAALKTLVHVDQAYHSALEIVVSGAQAPENINNLIASRASQAQVAAQHFVELAPSENFNAWHYLPTPKERSRRVEKLGFLKTSQIKGQASRLLSDLQIYGIVLSDFIYEKYGLGGERSTQNEGYGSRNVPRFNLSAQQEQLKRFTSGLFRSEIVWQPPRDEKIHHLPNEKIKPFLNKIVASIRQNLPVLSKYIAALDEYNKLVAESHFNKWLLKDGSKNRADAKRVDDIANAIADFDAKYGDTKNQYIKSYGLRVTAAVAHGKDHKAYASAKKLLTMLDRLARLQHLLVEAKVKAGTLGKLLERYRAGDVFHQASVSRLTKMLIKANSSIEAPLLAMPPSLLGEDATSRLKEGALDVDELNGADYEKIVLDRFYDLAAYFEAYNLAVSARLAKFVEVIEKRHGIESVVKVNLHT